MVQYHLWAIGGRGIELMDGAHLNRRVRGGGGGHGSIGKVLRVGCWCRGDGLLKRRGDSQARRGLERRVRKGGWWVSKGGGRVGRCEGGSRGLVAQIWEVQGMVGGAGRHIGEWEILHVWWASGEGKGCGRSMSGQRA